jgi:hypothetical protein
MTPSSRFATLSPWEEPFPPGGIISINPGVAFLLTLTTIKRLKIRSKFTEILHHTHTAHTAHTTHTTHTAAGRDGGEIFLSRYFGNSPFGGKQ